MATITLPADADDEAPNGLENKKPIDHLHQQFERWLAVEEDYDALDVILSGTLDRRIPGDPLWLIPTGVSGIGKSEILRSTFEFKDVFHLSNLTSRALISGRVREDGTPVKGLYKMIDGHVVVIPDFTEILQKPFHERDMIFGQFRNLYDGLAINAYGTEDKPVIAPCHIGLILGCTPAIDLYTQTAVILGERFLKVRLQFDRTRSVKRAMQNSKHLDEMRKELSYAVTEFLNQVQIRDIEEEDSTKQRIAIYGKIVANARIQGLRNQMYDTSEFIPAPENETRLNQQLLKLGRSLALLRGHDRITENDLATVSRVALDTIPPIRKDIILRLQEIEGYASIAEIVRDLQMRNPRITRRQTEAALEHMKDLTILESVEETTQFNEHRYMLGSEFRDLFRQLNTLTI